MRRPLLMFIKVSCALLAIATSALAQQPQTSANVTPGDNAEFLQGVGTGFRPTAGSGLTLNIAPGTAYCGAPPALVTYAGGSLTMAASQTYYVFLNPAASCAPASNTTGFSWGHVLIAKVLAGSSSITTITDARHWFVPQPIGTDASGRAVTKHLNNARYASGFDGTDIGAKVNAAMADLPSTGGVVVVDFEGTQSFTTAISVTKPIHLIGLGLGATVLNYTATSGNAITVNVASASTKGIVLEGFTLLGTDGGAGNNGIVIEDGSGFVLRDLMVDDFGQDGIEVLGDLAGLGTNTNLGMMSNVKSYRNGRYGIYTNGADANVIKFIGVDSSQNAEGFRINSKWNVFVGCHADDNVAAHVRFASGGDDNTGSFYLEPDAAPVDDLICDSGAMRNRIEWLNGSSGSITQSGCDVGDNSYMFYTPGWGWHGFPLMSIRPSASALGLTILGDQDDANLFLNIRPGMTADQGGLINFENRLGVDQWWVQKTSSNIFSIVDAVNSLSHMQLNQAGHTNINAGGGANAVRFNLMANSGTGGVAGGNGGASPSQTWSINGAGLGTFNGGLQSAKSIVAGLNDLGDVTGSVTCSASLGNTCRMRLIGNVTSALSNATAGQTLNFLICQDATGGRTFTWPSNVKGGMTIGQSASKCNAQDFIYDGSNAYALSAGKTNM